uniref:Uncharacterized protein n=1 Tax=Glossina morsitans morsitans TaxID=37546 RepID=A0A1B0G2W0_GLOMM
MSERGVVSAGAGRYARVSPIPGRGSKIAYSPCPLNDSQDMELAGNCLAIPMSSINTNNATNNNNNNNNNVNKMNKKGGCCSRSQS